MTVTVQSREVVYKGWSSLSRVTLSDGNATFNREVEDHGRAAAVLPFDPERRVALLVSMPRAPVLLAGSSALIEAPAGIIDPGEDAEGCARREAEEEAGVRLDALDFVANIWSSPGVTTERIALFLAPYSSVDRIGVGGGIAAEHENITVIELALSELAAHADAGELTDVKTLAMVQSLRLRRPELFA